MRQLAWIAVAFGGLYLIYRFGQQTGSPLVSDLDPLFGTEGLFPLSAPNMRSPSASNAAVLPYMRTTQPGGMSGTGPYQPIAPATSAVGPGGYTQGQVAFPLTPIATFGATAALAPTALVGAAGVATAGIGAGVGLLAWGIAEEGWFRGGEEGVQVNPARDRYLSQFSRFDYISDDRNPPGFYGLSIILSHLQRHDLFDLLAKADTMTKFNSAVSQINNVLATATTAQFEAIVSEVTAYQTGAVA